VPTHGLSESYYIISMSHILVPQKFIPENNSRFFPELLKLFPVLDVYSSVVENIPGRELW